MRCCLSMSMNITTRAHLEMTLRLHEIAHDTKGRVQIPSRVCGNGWNDGMVWALARGHTIRMRGIQAEVVTAVLECESAPFRNDACMSPCKSESVPLPGSQRTQDICSGLVKMYRSHLLARNTSNPCSEIHSKLLQRHDSTETHSIKCPRQSDCPWTLVRPVSDGQMLGARCDFRDTHYGKQQLDQLVKRVSWLACAETHVVGLDEGAAIALAIHSCEIAGVTSGFLLWQPTRFCCGCLHIHATS